MNVVSNSNKELGAFAAISVAAILFFGAWAVSPFVAVAAESDDFGCCSDYGYSYYEPSDYGSSYYGGSDYGYSYYEPSDYGYSYYEPSDYGYSYYEPSDYGYSYYEPSDYGYSYYEPNDYGYSYYGDSTGCSTCGLFNWDSYSPGYSSGGGYSTGGGYNMGGGSYRPTYTTGYPVTISSPRYPSTPSTPVSGGSQNQSQSQSSNNNNTNTNTNVNINNVTAVAVAQVPASYAAPSYPSYPSYPTYPAPYCNIYQAQSGSYGYSYGYNRPVYLSWSSQNATSAYLSNYGSVAVNGSQTVYPTYTTTYTLTVYGYNGQQATCQTTVYAGSTYVPPVQPTTPYVSLTQIPYTGFDFGTFGNAMYFAAIAIVALGGAYLAIFYVPQLALGRGAYKRSFAPVVAPKAPLLVEKEAQEAKVAPVVAALRKSAGTNDTMAIVDEAGKMPKIMIARS